MLNTSGASLPDVDTLAERLDSLCRFPPAASASRALAQALVGALSSRAIGRDGSERLGRQLYAAVNGGYLRRVRLDELTKEIEKGLLQSEVAPAAAAAVRDAAVRVAREPREARTDWW